MKNNKAPGPTRSTSYYFLAIPESALASNVFFAKLPPAWFGKALSKIQCCRAFYLKFNPLLLIFNF